MGCSPGGLAKSMINKAIGAAEDQLNTAEGELDKQLKAAVAKVDDPVNAVIKGANDQVESQTKAALAGLKAPLASASEGVKAPVDEALGQFKSKVNFDPNLVKNAAQPPIDEVNKKINEQKDAAKKKVMDELTKKASDPSFIKSLGLKEADKEIPKDAQVKIRETVESAVDPVQKPLIENVDGLVKQGKEALNTALEPALAPVTEVQTQIEAALSQVEAPVNEVKSQANEQLKPILDNVEGLVKAPVLQAAKAAKTPAEAACDAAKSGFEKAAQAALDGGNKGISAVPAAPAELISVSKEQLSVVVNAAKKRAAKLVDKNKNLINGKITNYETNIDDIVNNVKKTPPKAMEETFAEASKPLDDVKEPVCGPIKNVFKTVDETKKFAFDNLDKQRNDLDDFFNQLVLDGEKVIYDSLGAQGFKKA